MKNCDKGHYFQTCAMGDEYGTSNDSDIENDKHFIIIQILKIILMEFWYPFCTGRLEIYHNKDRGLISIPLFHKDHCLLGQSDGQNIFQPLS